MALLEDEHNKSFAKWIQKEVITRMLFILIVCLLISISALFLQFKGNIYL